MKKERTALALACSSRPGPKHGLHSKETSASGMLTSGGKFQSRLRPWKTWRLASSATMEVHAPGPSSLSIHATPAVFLPHWPEHGMPRYNGRLCAQPMARKKEPRVYSEDRRVTRLHSCFERFANRVIVPGNHTASLNQVLGPGVYWRDRHFTDKTGVWDRARLLGPCYSS